MLVRMSGNNKACVSGDRTQEVHDQKHTTFKHLSVDGKQKKAFVLPWVLKPVASKPTSKSTALQALN
jgi:hypothetical protein